MGNLGNMAFSPFRLSEARKNKFNIFFSKYYLFLPVRKRYRLIFSGFDYFFVKCINFEWARNRGIIYMYSILYMNIIIILYVYRVVSCSLTIWPPRFLTYSKLIHFTKKQSKLEKIRRYRLRTVKNK